MNTSFLLLPCQAVSSHAWDTAGAASTAILKVGLPRVKDLTPRQAAN
jgi:hypothetical protein